MSAGTKEIYLAGVPEALLASVRAAPIVVVFAASMCNQTMLGAPLNINIEGG